MSALYAPQLMHAPRRKRAPLAALAAAIALAVLLAWALGAFGCESNLTRRISAGEAAQLVQGGTPRAPHGHPVTVEVGESAAGKAVRDDFLGLSFEATAIPLLAEYAQAGNLIALLRSLGPGVIRIGGVSVDTRVAWVPEGAARPSWATVAVTPAELRGLATLARESGWKVLLTVDLGHFEPRAAAEEAAAAHSILGPTLAGVAIGNEPDRYEREGLRGPGWSTSEYLEQLRAYRAAIAHTAPGVSIVAPDASSGLPPLPWVSATASTRPALLSDHYYPLSSCDGERPSLGELASPLLRTHEDDILSRLQAIEREARIPLAIDESGSISCHGEPGVSNSFESSLWATDWIVRAMGAGIAGLYFHDLLTEPGAYSPLVLPSTASRASGAHAAADLHANPDWYALLLTSSLPGSTPVAARVGGDPDLTAAAFAGSAGTSAPLRLVLVDFAAPSAQPLVVHLRVPASVTGGSVLRLMAPSSASLADVQLGGAQATVSGTWRASAPLPGLYGSPPALSLELPASSAALVTFDSESRAAK